MRILPALDAAREEIDQLRGSAKAAIRIATGDLWGLVILPNVIRLFAEAHPDIVLHVDITDEGTRQEGLQNGVYDLVFGTLSPRYGPIGELEFEPLVRQSTYVYCDRHNALTHQRKIALEDLRDHRWISLGYDDDGGPGLVRQFPRDFAVRADTTMNALLLLRNSCFVMSASSGFEDLFREFGVHAVRMENAGPSQPSGVIYLPRTVERPQVRHFLRRTRRHVRHLGMPTPP